MKVTTAQMDFGRVGRGKCIYRIENIPNLSDLEKENLKEVTKKYAFRSNEYYLSLIDWNDPDDPIRRLVIPDKNELISWGRLDASNEGAVTVRKGVQHKYGTTVLLLLTETCGSFCRYCFRKRLFMEHHQEVDYDATEGIEYVRRHPEVNNVLLTGGDPLVLSTRRLEGILGSLREIDHLRIIRIGTKIPAFNPFRIIDDPELLRIIRRYSLRDRRIYFMCHYDHPRELTAESRRAIQLIQDAGGICVNQNPIIRGISDSPEVMSELWNELSYIGVPQYYVFQNRPTAGNEPYHVPIVEAYFKIEKAKRKCSGLAKRAKYVMSHESGKIEVVGVDDVFIYLKYHRAKDSEDEQRLVICHRDDQAGWYDELRPVNLMHLAV